MRARRFQREMGALFGEADQEGSLFSLLWSVARVSGTEQAAH